ncbi:MAG: hypothetical protein AAB336_10050 [Acidobacteriota bacterium]
MKIVSLILIFSIWLVTTHPIPAQTNVPSFEIDTLVSNGKKSDQVESMIYFQESTVKNTNKKSKSIIKEFNYADIKAADYSYAKKPLLSTTGAVVSVVLLGLFALPFMFMKKKQHWLTLRTESDYVVLRLDKNNFRQILNELEIRKVKVTTVNEDEDSNKKEKKDN